MKPSSRQFLHPVLLAAALLAWTAPSQARVVRIVIEKRESPAYDGRSFGSVGRYEKLQGHAFGELDPKDPLNAIITDIQFAPRNARGMVEYSATFTLIKPVDMSKASGVLLYNVANRGRAGLDAAFDEGRNPGDGFFLKRGDALLYSGWQGDVLPRPEFETISVPVAKNPDGSSITGPVLLRLADMPPNTNTMPLGTGQAGLFYQRPASMDTSLASLKKRAYEGAELIAVPSHDWAFADCRSTPFPGKPDPSMVCVKGGFDPAYLYEVVFTAKDPLVLGIGFAATRDINSFFKHEEKDENGTANPVAKRVSYLISQGTSQSGNFEKTFIHLGFNQDEAGRIVWDGVNDHIPGRQLPMNVRFGTPGSVAGLYELGWEGVLWWNDYPDELRHRKTAGMLDRCTETGTCPKVMETFGGVEFWNLRVGTNLVGTKAEADIPLAPNVRRYYFPSTTHGGGRGGFVTTSAPPANCALPANPNPELETMRALLTALIDWVVKGTPPPPSRYPRLDQGQLAQATQKDLGFPDIPGVPSPDGVVNTAYDYDFGPHFNYNDESGIISIQPPVIKQVIPTLVPKVDADGNEFAGVRSVQLQAPLGTYLGWNVFGKGYFKGRNCGLNGGFIPFAATKAERTQSGDPRPSLEERYGSHDAYVAMVRAAAAEAVRERFLLQEDADRLVAQAAASTILKQVEASGGQR
ncbi:MAG: alpha/beta hydrolase domain-containing protein [Bryobacteraceae bacterium]